MDKVEILSKRTELGWSQERLARELGVSIMTIRRWEAGASTPSQLSQKVWGLFIAQNEEHPNG